MAVKDFILDLLFPRYCVGCGSEGQWICGDCLKKINPANIFRCPVCGKITADNHPCGECLRARQTGQPFCFLDGLWAVADYNNAVIAKSVSLLKYNYILDLTVVMEKLVEKFFTVERNWPGAALLVPVPLHRDRYLRRGFNQAEIICEIVKAVKGNEIEKNFLRRTVNNPPQAKLPAAKRRQNSRGIFSFTGLPAESGREAIIVDDVFTTGSTMQEGAKILKQAGFVKVWGFAIARG